MKRVPPKNPAERINAERFNHGRPVARILPFTEEPVRPLLGSVNELGGIVVPVDVAWDASR